MKKLIRIGAFELVYLAIAAATFQHTTWSAAMTFEGPRPIGGSVFQEVSWYINGVLLAIAIDIGMLVAARELARRATFITRFVLTTAFLTAALASFYTQVLYSAYHTNGWVWGQGVTGAWVDHLQPFVDARVVIIPAMLPVFAIVYTLAQIAQQTGIKVEKKTQIASLMFKVGGKQYGPYKNERSMEQAKKRIMRKDKTLTENDFKAVEL